MNPIRFFVAALILALVSLWKGWTEPFHLVIGSGTLVLGGTLVALWRQRQAWGGADTDADEPTEGLVRSVCFGGLGGALVCLALAGVFAVAGQVEPVVRLFRDGDRARLEAQLHPVLEAGNHAHAIALIQHRLAAGKLSLGWRTALLKTLYSELVATAGEAADFGRCTELLGQAVSLAQTNAFDGQTAATLLERVREREAVRVRFDQLKAGRQWAELIPALRFAMSAKPTNQWELPYDHWLYEAYVESAQDCGDLTVRKAKLQLALQTAHAYRLADQTAVTLLEATEKEAALGATLQRAEDRVREEAQGQINRLQTRIMEASEQKKLAEQQAHRELQQAKLQAEYAGLLQAGDGFQDPDVLRALERRGELYAQARAFAQANGLELQPVSARLSRLNQDLTELRARRQREAQPADLPVGAQVTDLRVNTDRFPPSLDLSLAVEDHDRQPVLGLRPKDFQVSLASQIVTNVAMAAVQTQPPPLYLALAIDCSGSMRGQPMQAAIQGAQVMIRSLSAQDRVFVRVFGFNDKVRSLCPWTEDRRQAAAAVAGLAASGSTALYAVAETALQELKACQGDRRLVLFTDGCDTIAPRSYNLAALAAALRAEDIPTFTIGLQTAEMDEAILQRLATGTGGQHFKAAGPSQLVAQFLAARQQLRRSLYRLVLTPELGANLNTLPLQIKVGGSNAVSVVTWISMASQPAVLAGSR